MQASHEDWQHETLLERVWEGNHPHVRKQAQLVEKCDGDAVAAAEELVHPTRPSFREELGRRPMDKGILEEIYMNLHGKRIERKLKKGVSWEHWISKGEGTAPVFTASHKAQQAFGMGGHVRWWASAREVSQFPILRAAKEAPHSKRKEKKRPQGSSLSSPLQNSKIHRVDGEENAGEAETARREETESNREVEEEGENGLLLGCVSHRSHRPLPPSLPHRQHPTAAASSSSSSSTSLLLPPEFAFIGRTSSGKSSLLNAIVNAAVAPYGHLQGTTTAVNFYRVGGGSGGSGGACTLVDCPGYGFFNPMQTPEVEAANAVKVMKDYLYQGGIWAPRRRLRSIEEEGRASSGIPKRTPPPLLKSRKKKKKQKGGQEESEKGTPSTFFYTGVEDMPAAHEETNPPRRRGRNEIEEEEEDEKGAGERSRGRVALHRRRPLQRVFVCASSRGLQHLDWRYCDLLESIGVPFTVVLTKTDAAPIRFLARLTDYTRCRLVQYKCCKELMLTSALRLSGVDKMQNLIASMLPSLDGRRAGRRGEDDGMDFSSLV